MNLHALPQNEDEFFRMQRELKRRHGTQYRVFLNPETDTIRIPELFPYYWTFENGNPSIPIGWFTTLNVKSYIDKDREYNP